jgi:spermidine/putrescine transport system substrate-binding protein
MKEGAMRHPRERWNGQLSRRDFLRRGAGAAVALPSAAAILAACSNPNETNPAEGLELARRDNPVTLPVRNEPIADGLPIEKGATLKIFNWDQYLWKHILVQFREETGVDFEITTFNNMDGALAKINTGQLAFDVVFPTVDVIGKLVAADYLQPLNKSYIPNLEANIWPELQDPFYDKGSQYTVPYVVYTTGIGYRRDVIPDETIYGMDNPFDILWDPQYSGKVGIYDDYREAISMALQRNGIQDVNTTDPQEIETAKNSLIEMIDAVNVRYSINGAYRFLPQGQYDVHQAWSGDIVAGWGYVNDYTQEEYENLGYWFPEDRVGPVLNDLMVIPKDAPSPVAAHTFLNYMLDFQHAMDNFSWVGYQPPQNEADPDRLTKEEGLYSKLSGWAPPINYVPPWMPSAVVRKEDFDVGLMELELAPETDNLWHDAWQEFQAGAQ